MNVGGLGTQRIITAHTTVWLQRRKKITKKSKRQSLFSLTKKKNLLCLPQAGKGAGEVSGRHSWDFCGRNYRNHIFFQTTNFIGDSLISENVCLRNCFKAWHRFWDTEKTKLSSIKIPKYSYFLMSCAKSVCSCKVRWRRNFPLWNFCPVKYSQENSLRLSYIFFFKQM